MTTAVQTMFEPLTAIRIGTLCLSPSQNGSARLLRDWKDKTKLRGAKTLLEPKAIGLAYVRARCVECGTEFDIPINALHLPKDFRRPMDSAPLSLPAMQRASSCHSSCSARRKESR